eukprot:CAMPEP_0174750574 /NCGR_PEP_ID=MMETSP1094-20130205/98022_1 /TAXON_ID=156173 /ORGANISM="Chrysochromulina brevifilum, Strain UTEX LB 985" /LENGTH=105 /DNA_ID=CAMNT_0015955949 /DNA_START=668 /DNA_END=986 /DNA_ORIENTATION=-
MECLLDRLAQVQVHARGAEVSKVRLLAHRVEMHVRIQPACMNPLDHLQIRGLVRMSRTVRFRVKADAIVDGNIRAAVRKDEGYDKPAAAAAAWYLSRSERRTDGE